MVGKAELSEGQRQLSQPTRAGMQKHAARRAEVEERLLFRGGINGSDKQQTQNGSSAVAGTVKQGSGNQPLSSGSRGTIVNITA